MFSASGLVHIPELVNCTSPHIIEAEANLGISLGARQYFLRLFGSQSLESVIRTGGIECETRITPNINHGSVGLSVTIRKKTEKQNQTTKSNGEFTLFYPVGGPKSSKLRLKSPVGPPKPPGIEPAEREAHAVACQGRALLIEVPGRLRGATWGHCHVFSMSPWSNLAKKMRKRLANRHSWHKSHHPHPHPHPHP